MTPDYYSHNLQIEDVGHCSCWCHTEQLPWPYDGLTPCTCGWRLLFPEDGSITGKRTVLRHGKLTSRIVPFQRQRGKATIPVLSVTRDHQTHLLRERV